MNKIPNWQHLPARIDVERLPMVQQELFSIFNEMRSMAIASEHSMGFSTEGNYNKIELLQKIPNTAKLLNDLKLVKYFRHIGLFWLRPGLSELPIHIDDPLHKENIALNIPVMNCADSYTVWYDAEIDYNTKIPDYATDGKYDPGGRVIKGSAREIDRVNCSFPSWVNLAVPHQGVYTGSAERINASFRFTDKFYDLVDTEYFYNNLVMRA
jgi:hypothetical protein